MCGKKKQTVSGDFEPAFCNWCKNGFPFGHGSESDGNEGRKTYCISNTGYVIFNFCLWRKVSAKKKSYHGMIKWHQPVGFAVAL